MLLKHFLILFEECVGLAKCKHHTDDIKRHSGFWMGKSIWCKREYAQNSY